MKIEIKNYTKTIRKNIILDNINLNLESGNIYGFIGRNGSGKSMLFKSICGLTSINQGEILIDSHKLGCDIEFPKSVGAVLDNGGFLPNLSGLDNLILLASINNKATIEDIKKSMSILGLDPNDNKSVKKYSLGMKQKLSIAQALMENPSLLILDEPFNGLDKHSVDKKAKRHYF